MYITDNSSHIWRIWFTMLCKIRPTIRCKGQLKFNQSMKRLVTWTEALNLAQELIRGMQRGLSANKFISNDEEVMKYMPEPERSQAIKNICHFENISNRTLGANWSIKRGIFIFSRIREELRVHEEKSLKSIFFDIWCSQIFITLCIVSKGITSRIMETRGFLGQIIY